MRTPNPSNDNHEAALKSQVYAQLQHCGVDIYECVDAIQVDALPWIAKVCELLGIETSACLFDAQQAFFDKETKQLHLPKSFYGTESDLKKAIWRNIQQWV